MAIVSWIRQRVHNLSARLLITYLTLMILGLGGVIAWTGRQLAAQSFQQAEQELALQAHVIANALREPVENSSEGESVKGRSLDDLVNSYAQNVGGRVTLVSAGLQVLSSSDPTVPLHLEENHVEFVAASHGSERYEIRRDEWRQEERLFVAAPILDEHMRPIGFAQLSVPTLSIYSGITGMWVNLFGIGFVVLLLTVLASAWLARQVAIPVQQLTATSEQIAAGHMEQRVVPAGPSEVRRLGLAFNRMADRVQEMIAQQRAFVDNASHELRSPLTALGLRLEILEIHGDQDPDLARRYVSQMQRQVQMLQRLVDHLLALATVEGSAPVHEPLDLARLLRELVEEMDPLVHQAGLKWRVDISDQVPLLKADTEQMGRAVRNLLDNAIKYTPQGGTVTLSAQTAGEQIEICVGDSGVGIAPDELEHVFDRFYRVDRVRSRDTWRGVGLGLALVRSIVQANGGTISVSSRVDEGSTFTIALPLSAAQTSET